MIRDFVACNIPICDECVIGVVEGSEVGHFRPASIWVLSLGEELVDSVESIRLDSIISTVDDELGHI